MDFQNINIGNAPNDGLGDTGRAAGAKINANFAHIDAQWDTLSTVAFTGNYEDLINKPAGGGGGGGVSSWTELSDIPAIIDEYSQLTPGASQIVNYDSNGDAVLSSTTPYGMGLLNTSDDAELLAALNLGTASLSDAEDFAAAAHVHDNATTSVAGFMAAADKTKLDGVATNATANVGTVTSVAITGANGITVANGTITTSGTAAIDINAAQLRTALNVANGATANSADATLLDRANHTGTQAISTVTGLQAELDGKISTGLLATYAPLASPTFTGTVAGINKTMVGLGNVDNTSDVAKPVSTLTQTALDLKLDIADFETTTDTTLDTIFGDEDGIYARTAGVKEMLGGLDLGPTTIFDLQTGAAPDLATYELITAIHTGSIVSNVATLDWSTDLVSRPVITLIEAAANFSLVLPVLPSEISATGARSYKREVLLRNVGLSSITCTLSSSGIPLRGTNPVVTFGEWALITIDYATPLGFGVVTTTDLGASIPPLSILVSSNRGTSAGGISISGFDPYIYTTDEVLVFVTRDSGTSITLPAGKPWVYVNGGGGLDANGMISNASPSNGSRLARAVGHVEGEVNGTGTFTNGTGLSICAYRGVVADSWEARAGTDDSVEWGGFTGVPDGGFAVCYTAVNQSAQAVPVGSVAVHTNGEAAVSPGGWRNTTRRFNPTAGVITIPPLTLAAAVSWHTITVLMVPGP